MEQYVYLVAYAFKAADGGGSGRVFVTRTEPISSPGDIESIEAFQNERDDFKCAVTSFQLLSYSETDD